MWTKAVISRCLVLLSRNESYMKRILSILNIIGMIFILIGLMFKLADLMGWLVDEDRTELLIWVLTSDSGLCVINKQETPAKVTILIEQKS